MKHIKLFRFFLTIFILLGIYITPVSADSVNKSGQRWTYADVFESGVMPFAIGHRGYGANLGEVTDLPIENTAKSI